MLQLGPLAIDFWALQSAALRRASASSVVSAATIAVLASCADLLGVLMRRPHSLFGEFGMLRTHAALSESARQHATYCLDREISLSFPFRFLADCTVAFHGRWWLAWRTRADSKIFSSPEPIPEPIELIEHPVHCTVRVLLQSLLIEGELCCAELARRMGAEKLRSKDDAGRSVLHHAALQGSADLCAVLLGSPGLCAAGDVDHEGSTALHCAASEGHRAVCETLLNLTGQGELDAKDRGGQNALHVAAWKGHAQVCEALTRHRHFGGADSKDRVGRTALHWAAFFGHAEACRTLLGSERFTVADALTWKAARREEGEGCTALHLAALGGHVEACHALLGHPRFSAASARECGGLTALQLAEEVGHDGAAAVLLAGGAP